MPDHPGPTDGRGAGLFAPFDENDWIGEGVIHLGEFFDFSDDVSVAHPSSEFLRPEDETREGMPVSEPVFAGALDRFVVRHEDSMIGCSVAKEDIVMGSLREEVDRSLDVPVPLKEAIDDLLAHAGVEEEREATGH